MIYLHWQCPDTIICAMLNTLNQNAINNNMNPNYTRDLSTHLSSVQFIVWMKKCVTVDSLGPEGFKCTHSNKRHLYAKPSRRSWSIWLCFGTETELPSVFRLRPWMYSRFWQILEIAFRHIFWRTALLKSWRSVLSRPISFYYNQKDWCKYSQCNYELNFLFYSFYLILFYSIPFHFIFYSIYLIV